MEGKGLARLCALALVLALTLGIAGEAFAVDAWYEYIYVSTKPTKTAYTVGESFDSSGLVIGGHVVRSDGTTSEYTLGLNSLTVSPSTFTVAGNITVKLTLSCMAKSGSMESFSTTMTVTVKAADTKPDLWCTGIKVKTAPTKTVYTVGEKFDPSGINVVTTTYYKDGSSNTGSISNECYYSYGTFDKAGTVTVTAYADLPDIDGEKSTFKDTFTVTVKEAASGTAPSFTTKSTALPDGTVGVAYSTYIKASGDGDIEIAQYYNPGKSNNLPNGVTFSSSGSGHLRGTPTKAGTFTFWAYAISDYGDDYREFTVTIKAATATTAPTVAPTVTPTAAPTPTPDATQTPEAVTPTPAGKDKSGADSVVDAIRSTATPTVEPTAAAEPAATATTPKVSVALIAVLGGLLLAALIVIGVLVGRSKGGKGQR